MSRKKDDEKGTKFLIKTMKKVAFHNLGCKVNSYEMEVMQQIIQKNGYEIVQFTQKADVYIVNTCTVTNIADRKSRQMLHRAKQLNPEAVVVAVGCYAQTGSDILEKDDAVDIIVGNNNKTKIAEILDDYFKAREEEKAPTEKLSVITDLTGPSEYENGCVRRGESRTRADVKIQDGCNQFCSYCAIPLARGRVRSRKPEDVIEEIKTLAKNGHREIVLTGIHICSYGIDFDEDGGLRGDYRGQTKLFDLIEMIDKAIPEDEITGIRLGSLEPRVINSENVKRLVKIKRVCPHFHLSLQSGCDETLKRMNRHYTTAEYKKCVELIRKAYGKAGRSVSITTDVIVGFPGETEEEFETTRAYLEDLKLYEMHIFKYSRRKGTVADRLPGQLTDAEKSKRSDILIEMTNRHSLETRARFVGKELSVLVEEEKQGMYIGHTPDYIKVCFDAKKARKIFPQDLSGKTVTVLGMKLAKDMIIAEI